MHAAQTRLTSAELVERARKLAPSFAERAARAEATRRVPPESVEEIVAAEIPAALVPRRFGGHEFDLTTWLDVTIEVGRGCGSTAWCVSLALHYGLIAGMFPEAAQQAVWSDGPGTLFAAALFQRSGAVTAVPGGYRVTGEFPNASGVDAAQWVMVGGAVRNGGGRPQIRLLLIPPDQYAVRDTWYTTGMRGTGSNTIVVEDVFVPSEHSLSMLDKVRGTTPGGELHGGMYQLPWSCYSGLTFVAPLLGSARGAVDHFTGWIVTKKTLSRESAAEQPHVQAGLAEVDARLDAAELLLRRAVAEAERGSPSEQVQRRATRDWGYSARLVTEAVEQLYRLGGTGVQAEGNPIQRAWRDVHAGASHISLDAQSTAIQYGRALLGLPPLGGNPFG
jgi:3-hydroxy-9,10-secoandrosta-1,3,5(10)-triene-9,17-dione monooxygenase